MAVHQVRYFTVAYYLRELNDGLVILYGGLSDASHLYFSKLKRKFREKFRKEDKDVQDVEHSPRVEGPKIDESAELQNNDNRFSASSLASLILVANGEKWELQEPQGEDDHPATLHYSFVLLSKMLNTCTLYIPAFAFGLRFGLSPSRSFIVVSYLFLVSALIGSFYMTSFAIEPSIQMFVGRMNRNLKRICIFSAVVGQVGYIIHGLFSCAYVLYQRQFLQNFIYHSCSIITLARSYQRHQMIYLFVAFNLFSFMSEPLFGLLALAHDVRQPDYWPSLDPMTFKLCKCLTIFGCTLGAGMLSSGTVVIPLMTCSLIMSSMKHLKNLVVKQSTRCSRTATLIDLDHNDELIKMLNSKTRKIMIDFACETLTMDWPIVVEAINSTGNFVLPASSLFGYGFRTDSPREIPNQQARLSRNSIGAENKVNSGNNWLRDAVSRANMASSKLNSGKSSSLLFLYKNLIKSLSELKYVIQDYERKFGHFHQISSLLACLMISLWVTSALTDARQTGTSSETDTKAGADAPPIDTKNEAEHMREKSAYTTRIFWSTVAFVLSNVFIFLKCDGLSDQITKIKSQLFKMNIDLACTFISAQRKQILQNMLERTTQMPRRKSMTTIMPKIKISSDSPDSNSSVILSSSGESLASVKQLKFSEKLTNSIYEVDKWRKGLPRLQYEHYVNQCPELDQIWSLYDQVDRISSRVNFRFTSTTYYSKKCMLLVFGRAVSLVLFYIQIIDMYSN